MLWKCELPDRSEDAPVGAEAPLHWDGEFVSLPTANYEFAREDRADPSKRGYRFDLHRVDANGDGTTRSFSAASSLIASHWSFLDLGHELLLHTG
ncbi:MAG: hypothetical protein WBG86_15950 [Polyangiales bacterium]